METFPSPQSIPNHFTDEEILNSLRYIIAFNDDHSDVQFKDQNTQASNLNSLLLNHTEILKYNLSCGLVTKLRNNIDRLKKRLLIRNYTKYKSFSISKLLYHLVLHYTTLNVQNDIFKQLQEAHNIHRMTSDATLFSISNQKDYFLQYWDDITLYEASEELICKG